MRDRVRLLLKEFAKLQDTREPWRVLCRLHEVLLLGTCPAMASCDDMAIVRGFALGLVRAHTARGSKTRRKSADWDPDILPQIGQTPSH